MIDQYLSHVNGTGDPAVSASFHEYQNLYQQIKSDRKKAHRIAMAIQDSVDDLVNFIFDELREF